jgi:hypothetical protein
VVSFTLRSDYPTKIAAGAHCIREWVGPGTEPGRCGEMEILPLLGIELWLVVSSNDCNVERMDRKLCVETVASKACSLYMCTWACVSVTLCVLSLTQPTLVCNEVCNFIQLSSYKGILGEAPHVYCRIRSTLISIPVDEAAKRVFHPRRIQNVMCHNRVSQFHYTGLSRRHSLLDNYTLWRGVGGREWLSPTGLHALGLRWVSTSAVTHF